MWTKCTGFESLYSEHAGRTFSPAENGLRQCVGRSSSRAALYQFPDFGVGCVHDAELLEVCIIAQDLENDKPKNPKEGLDHTDDEGQGDILSYVKVSLGTPDFLEEVHDCDKVQKGKAETSGNEVASTNDEVFGVAAFNVSLDFGAFVSLASALFFEPFLFFKIGDVVVDFDLG